MFHGIAQFHDLRGMSAFAHEIRGSNDVCVSRLECAGAGPPEKKETNMQDMKRTMLTVLVLGGGALVVGVPAAAADWKGQSAQVAAPSGQTVTAEVLGVDEKNLALLIDGAVVDVKVDHDTKIEGTATKLRHRIEARLDHTYHPGDMAKVVLVRDKLENRALSIESQGASAMARPSGAEAGRARAAERTQAAAAEKISGAVVGVEGRDLIIDVNGLAVKLRADHETALNGQPAKMEQTIEHRLERNFTPGQKVSAAYERYRLENRAISISGS